MDKKILIALSLLPLMVAGCQTAKISAPNSNASQNSVNKSNSSQVLNLALLKDHRWLVKSIINSDNHMLNLEKWRSGRGLAYFEFYDNENKSAYSHMTNIDNLMGFTYGCNDFSAGMSLVGDRLIINKTIMGTLVGCGNSEDELNDALKGENTLSYDAKLNQLTITTHNNYRFILEKFPKPTRVVPTQQDLESYHWQLSFISENGMVTLGFGLPRVENQTDMRRYPILSFENGRAYYSVGCNQLSSEYKMTPYGIANTVKSISTFINCPTDLAKAEDVLQRKMQGASEMSIIKVSKDTANLFQKVDDGSELMWEGKLKPEIKYGKGETLFLEIAPSDEHCDKKTNKLCLMVRELTYNEQGIITNKGEWHLWNVPIVGYQKSPDKGNILRLKKYRTLPTMTEQSRYLYILDNVIKTTELII